jgi:diguanylate cyclase (GGDEF)-like protein
MRQLYFDVELAYSCCRMPIHVGCSHAAPPDVNPMLTPMALLAAIAEVLRDQAGKNSLVARLGGEEFIVVLPGSDVHLGASKAEQLRTAIEDLEPSGLPVTASFGVAQLRANEVYENVFSRADSAMYEAKQDGRNRVVSAG